MNYSRKERLLVYYAPFTDVIECNEKKQQSVHSDKRFKEPCVNFEKVKVDHTANISSLQTLNYRETIRAFHDHITGFSHTSYGFYNIYIRVEI